MTDSSIDAKSAQSPKLSSWRLAAFAAPNVPLWLSHGPARTIVPSFYAVFWGLSLETIGWVVLIARLIDAFTDPVVGYLSDHTRSRFGRRIPWVVGGVGITCIAVYLLFVPLSDSPSGSYFLCWFVLVYTGWTIVEVPYGAWAVEVTRDYHQRLRVFAFRSMGVHLGQFAFFLIPMLPFFPTNEITPQTLKVVAVAVSILLPLSVIIAVRWPPPEEVSADEQESFKIREMLQTLSRNKPLLLFVAAMLVGGLGGSMYLALSYLYIAQYLQLAEHYALIAMVLYLSGILPLPFVPRILDRFEKHLGWAIASLIATLFLLLMLLIEPGKNAFILFLLLGTPIGLVSVFIEVAAASYLADIIDYDTFKSGRSRASSFMSLLTLIGKTNIALGSAIAFWVISAAGYDAAVGADNSGNAILGLKMAYLVFPCALFLIAAAITLRFPITKSKQRTLQRALQRRRTTTKL